MKNWQHSRTSVLIYRIILTLLTWATLILMFINTASYYTDTLKGFLAGLEMYKYYTMQTNLFVAIWLSVSLVLHFKPEKLTKIQGAIKGGLTIYISITFIVFAIMLSSIYNPTEPVEKFTNITSHYVIPIAFLVDWAFTEKVVKYKWLYLIYWLIYPLLYLVLAVTHGLALGDYLYPFLDINEMGLGPFFLSVGILLVAYVGFGVLFVMSNRFIYGKIKEIEEEEAESEERTEELEEVIEN